MYAILFVVTFVAPIGLFGADRQSKHIDKIPIYKQEFQHPFGYMHKLPDDGEQSPECYELLTRDRNTIAKVHVHTIEPKHLWVKLIPKTESNRREVEALLLLWQNEYFNSEEMKVQLSLCLKEKK